VETRGHLSLGPGAVPEAESIPLSPGGNPLISAGQRKNPLRKKKGDNHENSSRGGQGGDNEVAETEDGTEARFSLLGRGNGGFLATILNSLRKRAGTF